jgi:hypothetical protein
MEVEEAISAQAPDIEERRLRCQLEPEIFW